jgi:uncharacterized protein YqjF (DUF2071 family)
MADSDRQTYTAECPHSVVRPVMVHRWERLAFIHWAFDPEIVQDFLPSDLTVETYDGSAWVGLVPFWMKMRLPFARSPWLAQFPETNVRTYVRGPSGVPGVWFFSLDSTHPAAVPAARATYRVPYFWSRMAVERQGEIMRYSAVRIWPGPPGTRSLTELEVGDTIAFEDLEGFDHYLTARFVMYGSWQERVLISYAEHARWPLHRGRLLTLQDGLVEAAGLPPPTGEPVVHWSPGVEVRIGLPTFEQPQQRHGA